MSQKRISLRVIKNRDGDIAVCIDLDGVPIEDEDGNKAQAEFCSTSGGGGQSPRTRAALAALFDALLLDNKEDPTGVPPYPCFLRGEMEEELALLESQPKS